MFYILLFQLILETVNKPRNENKMYDDDYYLYKCYHLHLKYRFHLLFAGETLQINLEWRNRYFKKLD